MSLMFHTPGLDDTLISSRVLCPVLDPKLSGNQIKAGSEKGNKDSQGSGKQVLEEKAVETLAWRRKE